MLRSGHVHPSLPLTSERDDGSLAMQKCAICATPSETLTRDHVPPRALFGKSPSLNLITVPACAQCNREASCDDEYFRMLAVEWDASRISDPVGVTGSIIRSMQRPAARGFRQS